MRIVISASSASSPKMPTAKVQSIRRGLFHDRLCRRKGFATHTADRLNASDQRGDEEQKQRKEHRRKGCPQGYAEGRRRLRIADIVGKAVRHLAQEKQREERGDERGEHEHRRLGAMPHPLGEDVDGYVRP